MGALLIREMRDGDRAAVAEMLVVCGAFSDREIEVALELVDAGLGNGDYTLLVAKIAGAVRGYVCLGQTPLTVSSWDLYWICIHPEFQRIGAGRALQRHAEEFIQQQGGERIRVETSGRADYERARDFYRRAGFRVVGVIADFYRPGDPCVLFCKTLTLP